MKLEEVSGVSEKKCMERQDGGTLSTPLGSSKLSGQLELKLWPSKTGLSLSVLPGFCPEQAKKN